MLLKLVFMNFDDKSVKKEMHGFQIFFVVGNKCGTDIKISPGMDKQFKLFFMNFVIVSVFLFLRFNVKCNGY